MIFTNNYADRGSAIYYYAVQPSTFENIIAFNNEHFVIKPNPKPNLTSFLNPYKTEKVSIN